MGRAVFPPCCNEDNGDLLYKVLCMHCHTQCPRPSAGQHQPMLPPETPGHSQASLGRSVVEKLLFSPGFWYEQGFVCTSKSLFPQPCVSSGGSMVGLMATSSKRAYAICRSAAPRVPAPMAFHCWPVPPKEPLRHSSAQSLWGPGAHKVCLNPPSISGGYGV